MMRNLMLLTTIATLLPPALAVAQHRENGPEIEVWTNRDDVYRRGDQVRVYFRSSESGYVTVFRIDTDGRVRVLHPREPWEDNYARAGQKYEVRSYGDRYAFNIDDYPGQGYVFAVASRDPFGYDGLVRGDHWDYRVIAEGGRVTGDPYVALTDLVDRIVPPNYTEYSYDVQPYYVEQHYEYPRFLCYDCHSYASYSYWNPYDYSCFRFRIVIYNDFNYYPRRYYRGSRIVYRNAPRIAPRYVFKDRGNSEPYITTVRERPVDQSGRRVLDAGVRGRDLGGSGRVPAPITTGRERPQSSSDNRGSINSDTRRVPERSGDMDARGTQPDVNRRPVESPNDRPSRQPDNTVGRQPEAGSEQGSGRRPDYITPRAPSEEEQRQQPQLERRDPRREPERRNDSNDGRDNSSRGESQRPQVVPDRPRSEPMRQPDRQQERPRVEQERPRVEQERPRVERERPRVEQERPRAEPRPQPETRSQPQQSREPERRAEPRSEPRRAPEKARSPEPRRREAEP